MRNLAVALTLLASTVHAKVPKAPVPLEEYFKIRRVGSRSGILVSVVRTMSAYSRHTSG